MMTEMDCLGGGGGGEITIEDVSSASRDIPIKTGIVVQYVKSTQAVRAVAIIENGTPKVVSNGGYGAVTCTYSTANNTLTIGDTIYSTQPSALAYSITE